MPSWFVPLLDSLGNASGWVVLVAVLILIGFGFIHGDLVPGWAYKAAVKRANDAERRLNEARARDEAAAANAQIAREAAIAVLRAQRAGNGHGHEADEPA